MRKPAVTSQSPQPAQPPPSAPAPQSATALRHPNHDEICATAYHLHLEHGGQHGRDLDDWLQAEQLLLQRLNDRSLVEPSAVTTARLRA